MLDNRKLNTEQRIVKAKIQMFKKSPFFAYILLQMKLKKVEGDKEEAIPSMAVDNLGNLYYNAKFVDSLSSEHLLGVVAHETMHLALLHLERTGKRDQRIMNVAQDLVVNDLLKRGNDPFELPKEGMLTDYSHNWEYKGHKILNIHEKCAEEVYDELYALSDTIIQGVENGDLEGFDKHIPGNGSETKDGVKNKERWKKVVAEAAQLAKQRGKLPAGMERLIDDVLDSKVNWRTKLYRYMVNQVIYDYTWNTPSRRTASLGIYLPNTMKESLEIVNSIDTSGSIGQEELQQFISEQIAIAKSFPNVRMKLIICDADIHEVYDLSNVQEEDLKNIKMSGGGGTSHIPVYDYVKEHMPGARVLINFTDGYTEFPNDPDQYTFDSMWVLDRNGCKPDDIPFGEVIKIE